MSARIFGAKFLREWTRTLRLLKPGVFLIAEDHSGWEAVTQPADAGGLGFDATWFSEYYHQLIGDATDHPGRARLLKRAGYGDNQPLAMDWLAGTLQATTIRQVIYHESHDEAGNSKYRAGDYEENSARTIGVAVNNAPLIGDTRRYAEARVRFAAGLTLLARGIPMFFMGEEVGAKERYRYYDFFHHRENFVELKRNSGARLFQFYRNLIALRQSKAAFRSDNFNLVHVDNENRIMAFRRWNRNKDFLILASFNNHAFFNGYRFHFDPFFSGNWVEIFNSDGVSFGGEGIVNPHFISCHSGVLTAYIPANGIVVLERLR
jgi:1,4-alpha-glucan branching enzyme